MKDNTDQMDKTIKDKFEGHEVDVPAHLWNSIEPNLPPQSGITGGSFFFTNLFLLSVIAVGTIITGTYVYNLSMNKTNVAAQSLSQTSPKENISNNSSTTHTASNSDDQSAAGKISNTNHVFTSIPNTDTEDKNKTATAASGTSEIQSGNSITKNKAEYDQNMKQTYNTRPTKLSKINSSTSQSQNSNYDASNSNAQYKTAVNNKHIGAPTSNTKNRPDTYSDNSFSKQTRNNNRQLNSLHSSESMNAASANTSTTYSTHIVQTSNPNESARENNIHTQADSIELYTTELLKDSDSFNKTKTSNTSIHENPSNDTRINPSPDISGSSETINIKTAEILNATISLNANNTLSIPSEAKALYNQHIRGNEVKNQHSFDPYINQFPASSNSIFIDSADNTHTVLNDAPEIKNQTINTSSAFPPNLSTSDLLFKIDSTLTTEHTDTSIKNPSEIVDIKSNEEEKKKKPLFLSRCSFDGYVTPALGYLYLSPNSTREGITENIKERNQNAKTGFGITTGLRMNYSLTQKVEVGVGLQYSSLSQKSSLNVPLTDIITIYQGYNEVDSTYDSTSQRMIYSNRFVITDTTQTTVLKNTIKTYTDKFQNVSIPIHIAYGYSISNKLSLITRASFLINYQTYSVTYLNGIDSSIVGHHSAKNLSLGGSFSVGFYYLFSKKCSVFAESIVSYYFSNVFDKQAAFKQKQLMPGLQTGIRLSF
jgi:hypothetical protein